MARLQILELPEGAGDDRPPFILVVDEWDVDSLDTHTVINEYWDAFAKKIGARACLFVDRTIDIPANEITLTEATEGNVVRLRVEPDLTGFREQVMTEVAKAQADARVGLQ